MEKFPSMADVKLYYDWGCYTDEDIRKYVALETISQEEYQQITGKPF